MQEDRKNTAAGTVAAAIIHIVLIAAAVLILIFAAKKTYQLGYSVFTTGAVAEAPGEDIVVTIRDGMSDGEIGKLLQEKGLIRDALVYRIQAKVYEYEPLPGTYLLNTSETLDEMMEILMTPSAEEEESSDTVIPTTEAGSGN